MVICKLDIAHTDDHSQEAYEELKAFFAEISGDTEITYTDFLNMMAIFSQYENGDLSDWNDKTPLYLATQEINRLEDIISEHEGENAALMKELNSCVPARDNWENEFEIVLKELDECEDTAVNLEELSGGLQIDNNVCKEEKNSCFADNANLQKQVDYMKMLLGAVEPYNLVPYIESLNEQIDSLMAKNFNQSFEMAYKNEAIDDLSSQVDELSSSLDDKEAQYESCTQNALDLECSLQKCFIDEQENVQKITDYKLLEDERERVQSNRENSTETAMINALNVAKIFQIEHEAKDDVVETLIKLTDILSEAEPIIYWPFYPDSISELMMLSVSQFELAVSSYFCKITALQCQYGKTCYFRSPDDLFKEQDFAAMEKYLEEQLSLDVYSANIVDGFEGQLEPVKLQLIEMFSTVFLVPELVNKIDSQTIYYVNVDNYVGIPLFTPYQLF
uniref:uncharacterized protein LOC120346408 n=1 Tax=Styela clava TaxID=7725 RepID=UPI00193ADBD2|nr:uncharacterized protein LOC120346408 [Styela clava]